MPRLGLGYTSTVRPTTHKSVGSKPAVFKNLRPQPEYEVAAPYSAEDRVYLLRAVWGDIRFATLRWEGGAEKLAGIFREVQRGRKTVEEAVRGWRMPRCDCRVSTWNDCPMVGSWFPAVSGRAAEALGDLLEGEAVMLPVGLGRRKYFCVVPRVVRRALDEAGSVPSGELSWEGYTQARYTRFSFRREAVAGLSVFCIPQEPCKMFVTERFVRRVVERRLVGFNFQVVFPLRGRDRWERLAERANREHLAEGLKRGQKVSGSRVVVRFFLDHPNRIPRAKEERQVRAWAEKVGRAIWDVRSVEVPVGFLDRVVPDTGDCKVIFEGRDGAELRERLRGMVGQAEWAGPVWVGGERWRE